MVSRSFIYFRACVRMTPPTFSAESETSSLTWLREGERCYTLNVWALGKMIMNIKLPLEIRIQHSVGYTLGQKILNVTGNFLNVVWHEIS